KIGARLYGGIEETLEKELLLSPTVEEGGKRYVVRLSGEFLLKTWQVDGFGGDKAKQTEQLQGLYSRCEMNWKYPSQFLFSYGACVDADYTDCRESQWQSNGNEERGQQRQTARFSSTSSTSSQSRPPRDDQQGRHDKQDGDPATAAGSDDNDNHEESVLVEDQDAFTIMRVYACGVGEFEFKPIPSHLRIGQKEHGFLIIRNYDRAATLQDAVLQIAAWSDDFS
ncbi:unnamed protein product, partial [Amoebophrya sp. A120]